MSYGRYVDDIFVLFKSSDHLKPFQIYINSCHINMMLTVETEQNNKISLLDLKILRERGKLITSDHWKPTFIGVYTHFDSFLPDTYKISMIYTLVNRCFRICYRCFRICSSLSMFHQQLILLRKIFQKNGYPDNVIDRCFKLLLNRIHILKKRFLQLNRSLCD